MENLRGGGANKCNIGEHHNIRKQIFSFFGTRLSLFGGGGDKGTDTPLPGRALYRKLLRRMAENRFAPHPLGNFADINYLVEN